MTPFEERSSRERFSKVVSSNDWSSEASRRSRVSSRAGAARTEEREAVARRVARAKERMLIEVKVVEVVRWVDGIGEGVSGKDRVKSDEG